MPKNAVQRLQQIESDLKTIIHIYDIADKYKNEHGRSEAPEKEDARQSSLHNSFKKTPSFDTQCSQDVHSLKSRIMAKKPESTPSSSSALFTICESDHVGQPSSESINNADRGGTLTKKKTVENLKNLSNEFDLSYASVHELLKTSSKTLQSAHETLEYKCTETKVEGDREPCFCESIPYFEAKSSEDYSKLLNQNAEHNVNNFYSTKHNSEVSFIQLKEELESENAIVERSRSVPTRKENPVQKESHGWSLSTTSKSIGKAKHSTDSKKNKSSLEISPKHNIIPKKIPRLESPRPDITEEKNGTKPRSEIKNSQEKTNKNWSSKTEKDDQLIKRINGDANGNKSLKEVKSKTFGKEKSLKEKKVKSLQAPTDCNNQTKTCKTAVQEDSELWIKELSKIIEISNEKLEKMRFSKELALDIAKHLKNKYDEILEFKEQLTEKVQKLQKENEKLHCEIKEAQQSKMKLQLKIEGLKKDSKTKLTEQSTKTKSALEETNYLKTKMCEMERQFNEALLKKQKEIDQIQKERLIDIKNELKSRENREEDLQRLKKDKSELQSLLNDRHTKTIILEEKIRRLQEEIQKQKENLKTKTERLEETNKELESIRQNSRDLEEQVNTLRKNIENFDEIQKKLMKQTEAYDEQIKSNQEVIKKFHDENSKLKIELEKEKDAQLIKTKIIEDQQETIKKLREKAEETKTLMKRNQSLERILNTEREEKLELQEAVEHLKWRKEELKKKINSLENDLVMAPQEVIRDLKKTQIILCELENQVQIKQKEWELQLQFVLTEKEQARSVAEFATKKLMQITNEFQKQTQAHKRLQIILAENLAEKEKNQRETNEKATLVQSKHSLSHVCLDDKNANWSMDRHLSKDDILMNWYFKNPLSYHEDFEPKSNLHLP